MEKNDCWYNSLILFNRYNIRLTKKENLMTIKLEKEFNHFPVLKTKPALVKIINLFIKVPKGKNHGVVGFA